MPEPSSPTPAVPPASTASPAPQLVRPRDDRVVAGVASGIGRHLGVDPLLLRIAFGVLALAGGSGVLAYLVAWLVIPAEPLADGTTPAQSSTDPAAMRLATGAVLVLVGLVWLLERLVPGLGRVAWPVALIVIGSTILIGGARR